ncbi:MAG: hypothetical protein JWM33_397 [Caulobacteraceae bacterium]|nr:hypothetical protein [Caulobacteraceae bacterium]
MSEPQTAAKRAAEMVYPSQKIAELTAENARLSRGFMRRIRDENKCDAPCRDTAKCGCWQEVQAWCELEQTPTAEPSVTARELAADPTTDRKWVEDMAHALGVTPEDIVKTYREMHHL